MPLPSRVSLVVPTYLEAQSLPELIDRVAAVREAAGLSLDLIIVDDNSRDGTEDLIAARPEPWVELMVRTGERGLSQAVMAGLRHARGDVLVVMDADLSHPPEAIVALLKAIDQGAEFVIGSRYAKGGTTADGWGVLRFANSWVATALARPLTSVSDPMSGFFALPRNVFERAENPSPIGYKIGLELLVRCRCERVEEVPIHFSTRVHGESKLTLHQQLLYVQHLARLYRFKLGV